VFHQEVDIDRLVAYLQSHYPNGDYILGYEAGFCGFWIQEEFSQRGIHCKVLHAADIPTTDKEKRFKNDKRDCRKIARALSNDQINSISIPTKDLQYARSLVRGRYRVKNDERRIKCRIMSHVHFYGYSIGVERHYWSARIIERLKLLGSEKSDHALLLYLEELEMVRQLELKSVRQIRALSRSEQYKEDMHLLSSVPGIGLLSGMLFLTEIGDIRRFKTLDHLCSMCALIPNTDSSGDKDHTGGLTKRGKGNLRTTLIESAWVSIRADTELALAFEEYCRRMPKQKAIVKIARKLLNRIRYILLNKKPYIKAGTV
jgi:transposase